VAAVLLAWEPASACKCAPVADRDDWNRYDAVFDGVVVAVDGFTSWNHSVRFQVNAAWRGISDAKVTLVNAGVRGACGVDFRVGERWLVMASRNDDGKLQAYLCLGSHPLSNEDASRLPRPQLRVVREPASTCATCATSSDAGAPLLVLLFAIALRRRSRRLGGRGAA
jgi:MYXO-CTERM domain-containing protein